MCTRIFWSIFHICYFLFHGTMISKFFKPNWDDDGNISFCSAIRGCTSFNMISQTFGTTSMNHYFAPTLVSSFSSLESWISTRFCVVTPYPVTTFNCLLKHASSQPLQHQSCRFLNFFYTSNYYIDSFYKPFISLFTLKWQWWCL